MTTSDNVEEFDSLTQLVEEHQARAAEAMKHLLPIQKEVQWGSHWATLYPSMKLLVFGYCETEDEVFEEEIKAGADRDEAEWSLGRIRDAYVRGYRYGVCYSVVVPEGELGSTHLASILGPITPEQFEEVKRNNWGFDGGIPEWFHALWERGRRELEERRKAPES